MRKFRAPDFAGGIVTMPHKRTIIPLIDESDELVKILGACNFVYLAEDGKTLKGTNTDWLGIYDCILAKSPDHVPGRIGMVYGAGGASRAAVYALWARLKCDKIYIVNRDDQEVEDLLQEVRQQPDLYYPDILHVTSVAQAKSLDAPHYIVSTVPDFEPVTAKEVEARGILATFLQDDDRQGLMLDMCYHPPMTRNLKLAVQHGYSIIQGFTVTAAQFSLQWKLWTGKDIEMGEVFQLTERMVVEREQKTQANTISVAT